MNRRKFLVTMTRTGILIALSEGAAFSAPKQVTEFSLKNPRRGETVGGWLLRNRFATESVYDHRYDELEVTRVEDRKGNWMEAPHWEAPNGNPDLRPPIGYPCILLQMGVKQRGRWVWELPDRSILGTTLSSESRVQARLVRVGYNPAFESSVSGGSA